MKLKPHMDIQPDAIARKGFFYFAGYFFPKYNEKATPADIFFFSITLPTAKRLYKNVHCTNKGTVWDEMSIVLLNYTADEQCEFFSDARAKTTRKFQADHVANRKPNPWWGNARKVFTDQEGARAYMRKAQANGATHVRPEIYDRATKGGN